MSPIPGNDVFRMMSIRNAQQVSDTNLASNFVTYGFYNDIDAATLDAIETVEPLLFSSLVDALQVTDSRAEMVSAVTQFYTNSYAAYSDASGLRTIFSSFSDIYAWLEENIEDKNYGPIITKVEAQLGTTIADFIADSNYLERKLRLWDNLFALVISMGDARLREEVIRYIKIHRILEVANELSGGAGKDAMLAAFKAAVVLPTPVFPLPRIENDLPEAGEIAVDIEAEEADIEALAIEARNIQTAIEEVLDAYGRQALEQRKTTFDAPPFSGDENASDPGGDIVIKDPDALTKSNIDSISEKSRGVIAHLPGDVTADNYHVPYIVEALERKLNVIGRQAYSRPGFDQIIQLGTSLINASTLCTTQIEKDPCDPNRTVDLPSGYGDVKPIGIGDLLVIRQQLLKYEQGEIAHIENVMPTEERSRSHRKLDRVEENVTTETETVRESERDTQTTERHSLEKEMSNIVSSDSALEAGINVTAYGPNVSVNAGVSYSSSNSSTDAVKKASQYAREVTERAAERVREKVREVRSVTRLREIEEINTHGFDNTMTGADNVVGMYHWVDKFYHNQIWNLGKRLLFEFMIPEPAAFHIYSKASGVGEGSLRKPIAPDDSRNPLGRLLSYEDITVASYAHWAAYYGAENVTEPPAAIRYLTGGYNRDIIPENNFPTFSEDLTIPPGYQATTVRVNVALSDSGAGATNPKYVRVLIGKWAMTWYASGLKDGYLGHVTGNIPVSIQSNPTYYLVNVEITCIRSPKAFKQWQIETYNDIVNAYRVALGSYEADKTALEITQGVAIEGENPARNREIERTELKKGCIELITNQRFNAFNAMYSNVPTDGYPEFDQPEAMAEGDYIRFFEQAFEWSRTTYRFYEYFWGRKANWTIIKQYEDTDPLFTRFLQAGSAKVQVSVRPGYEEAVMHYLATGEIWNGGEVPTIDDPLYLSIVDEIRTAEDQTEGTPQGDPWITKVPTSLVMLQTDVPPELPDNSTQLGVN